MPWFGSDFGWWPGWGWATPYLYSRFPYHWWGWSGWRWPGFQPPAMAPEVELSALRTQADWLKNQLDAISKRIEELEKEA